MLGCDPKSGRILSLQPMHEPENNPVAHETLNHALWLFPKLDCLVYGRACSFKAFRTASGDLDQIKFYIIDGFHAHGHSRTCPCNPPNSSFARIILMCQLSLFFSRIKHVLRWTFTFMRKASSAGPFEQTPQTHLFLLKKIPPKPTLLK